MNFYTVDKKEFDAVVKTLNTALESTKRDPNNGESKMVVAPLIEDFVRILHELVQIKETKK